MKSFGHGQIDFQKRQESLILNISRPPYKSTVTYQMQCVNMQFSSCNDSYTRVGYILRAWNAQNDMISGHHFSKQLF